VELSQWNWTPKNVTGFDPIEDWLFHQVFDGLIPESICSSLIEYPMAGPLNVYRLV
jgi:hypothetical protein